MSEPIYASDELLAFVKELAERSDGDPRLFPALAVLAKADKETRAAFLVLLEVAIETRVPPPPGSRPRLVGSARRGAP